MKRALVLNALAVMILCAGTAAYAASGLDRVLNQMDATARTFRTAQADFMWDQYTAVVRENDYQGGTIYFRREAKGTQMAANITKHNNRPEKKYVLFTGSAVQVYQAGTGQTNKYNVGKNKAEVESFLVLGFGGGGHDLYKSFDVRYAGTEKIDGVATDKLELTPKSASVRNNFKTIILWIDSARGVSVQQQLISDSGDYRLAKYYNIRLNQNVQKDVFRIPNGK